MMAGFNLSFNQLPFHHTNLCSLQSVNFVARTNVKLLIGVNKDDLSENVPMTSDNSFYSSQELYIHSANGKIAILSKCPIDIPIAIILKYLILRVIIQ